MTVRTPAIPSPRSALRRVRPQAVPILQTAVAAVAAYELARALPLPDQRPVFASIAAVIALGVSYGQRGRRAVELSAGVMLGLVVADLIVHLMGTGPLQVGIVIVVAMSVAVLLRGGEMVIVESAVSALLLVSLEPSTDAFSTTRLFEALVGGGVALAVGSVFFPPDPALLAARAANGVFGELGGVLEGLSRALATGDPRAAGAALDRAREADGRVRELEETLKVARETARLAPPRRGAGDMLERYSDALPHLDYAVRNARILARHGLRRVRGTVPAPEAVALAVDDLAQANWLLAASFDDPQRADAATMRARGAAERALQAYDRTPGLLIGEVVSAVRSTAVDLVRAADSAAGARAEAQELPTEELLAVRRPLLATAP
jgi:uncharacterized membrane protein YgaE (UPF0421/DUF939 family)